MPLLLGWFFLHHYMHFVKKWVSWVYSFRNLKQYQESNPISFFLVKTLEKIPFRRYLSAQLAGLTFVSAIVAPQAVSTYSTYQTFQKSDVSFIDASTLTESLYKWPLARIGISQKFFSYHPGIDLVAPSGTQIFPIANGKVITVDKKPWEGYGNHIIVQHDNGTTSLYAHLSKITVKEGQTINKNSSVGQVGATGRATGSHLHLEIHQLNRAVNPLDVLPTLPTPSVTPGFTSR